MQYGTAISKVAFYYDLHDYIANERVSNERIQVERKPIHVVQPVIGRESLKLFMLTSPFKVMASYLVLEVYFVVSSHYRGHEARIMGVTRGLPAGLSRQYEGNTTN
ncbi:hypothetical protein pEaSNUABM49_00542 [Erwinia phage pEa_SNUABM_49]|nr:hypothetical protein pEaSNUABM49_00542 [Erwinia phage pEa_SNUABM_49]